MRLFLLILLFVSHAFSAQAKETYRLYPLQIETAEGIKNYQVETAQTYHEQKRGLMHRESLPPNQGMIFLHQQPKILRMWMKNTLIGLDMVFIDQFATVRHIHENAVPHDETTISSVHPVTAVLELNAGTVAKHGIAIGDRVMLGGFYGDGG